MLETVIKVENLSKKYIIGRNGARSDGLRHAIHNFFSAPFNTFRNQTDVRSPQSEEFWALNDISFEVKQGEVLGIIGRNGAGKSTLLKILSRITEPTSGCVGIRGRVASLLEVGTGFHPELTGRENVFLNGAILGMSREEIRRKFDEIVNFAEVEQFLDTPVKRYSSGMYVRLAFAVAAHLEPEILIIDEVLAVGDASFQKKCLGKMNAVSREGRTVLFVSHNMGAVTGLCQNAYLLDHGKVMCGGLVNDVVHSYMLDDKSSFRNDATLAYRHKGTLAQVESVELFVNGCRTEKVQAGDACSFRVEYSVLDEKFIGAQLSVSIMIFSEGKKMVNLWTDYRDARGVMLDARGYVECEISRWPFRTQEIRVDVFTHIGAEVQDWIEDCLHFSSYDGDYYRSGVITNPDQGFLFLDHEWRSYAIE